jgi:hypothetical protein
MTDNDPVHAGVSEEELNASAEKMRALWRDLEESRQVTAIPRFLSLDSVLALHRDTLHQAGGAAGIRDLALLESAVMLPQQHLDRSPIVAPVCRLPERRNGDAQTR